MLETLRTDRQRMPVKVCWLAVQECCRVVLTRVDAASLDSCTLARFHHTTKSTTLQPKTQLSIHVLAWSVETFFREYVGTYPAKLGRNAARREGRRELWVGSWSCATQGAVSSWGM